MLKTSLTRPRVEVDRAFELIRRCWPMWLVAFSLNGFFVYLGLLAVVDLEPRAALTVIYYTALCVALLLAAWQRRAYLVRRLQGRNGVVVTFALAAAFLVVWFLMNTALLSSGELAHRLAGQLVLWCLPTALVAASFGYRDLRAVAQGLVALACVYLLIATVQVVLADGASFRFSPLAELDYISAAMVPALGAVAVFFAFPRARFVPVALAAALVAAAVVPGSRGPIVALVGSCLALVVVQRHRAAAVLVSLVFGLTLGVLLSKHVGSAAYLSSDTGFAGQLSGEPKSPEPEGEEAEPISTVSIRRQWLETAITKAPEEPVFGHGVGMLVDDTPEAHRMGVAGQRIYPHNSFVEAAYSLGAIGLAGFLLVVGTAALAVARIVADRPRATGAGFLLALGAFAFVHMNVSGAIGADALMWAVAAMAVAIYSDGWPRTEE